MPQKPAKTALLLCLSVTAAPAWLCSGCGEDVATPAASSESGQRYEVRGVVRALPDPGSTVVMLQHEAIPDFVNADGEVEGMETMTMGLPLADGVSLDDLAVGDAVSATLVVDWSSDRFELTALQPLPDGVTLDLEKADEGENHDGHADHAH